MEWILEKIFSNSAKIVVWFNDLTGLQIDPNLGTWIIAAPVGVIAVFLALPRILQTSVALRRLTSEAPVLDADGKAVVEHIKDDLAKLQDEILDASRDGSNTDLLPLLKILQTKVEQTQQLVAEPDKEIEDVKLDRHGRIPRRILVRLVRETVLANLWAGNFFDESRRRRHTFHTAIEIEGGVLLAIIVRTPFAHPFADGELPYGIIVKQAGRQMLRMQWDPEAHDDIDIGRCVRGDWENVILSWNTTQAYIPKTLEPTEEEVVEDFSEPKVASVA